ncbi:MAG: hypothetical protein IVW36_00005 [Dehalococcoidia bacterium]|nr:hypothetical protein [Dehalococcoidia bacterium]
MRRNWWIVGIGGAVALTLVGAGVVMAQTPTPGASGTGTSFLDRVAQKLGIESTKLQSAVNSAATDQINAELAAGTITQAQADKMKQAVANGDLPGFEGPKAGKGHGGGFGRGFGAKVNLANLASFLGVSQATLTTELQAANATLATVAQAHGKSRAQLKTFLTSEAKKQLDQAVTNKDLTQAQADAKLNTLNTNLDALVDAPNGGHMRGVMRGRESQEAPETPDAPGAGSATPGTGAGFGAPHGGGPASSAIFRS